MKTSFRLKTLSFILVIIFISIACGGTPQAATQPAFTPTPQQPSVTQPALAPTVQQPASTQQIVQNTPQPAQISDTLSSTQKQQLAHATVRIAMLRRESGELHTFATGSGTIISPDGLILTNCHIAHPTIMGYPEDEPDELGIEIVNTEDQPPVPTYFAKVVAADGTLDIAVLKVDRTLDDTPVKPASLNLPFVNVGDSDTVKFGDPIYIFGFPGIGGDTITYTSGSVSGFDSMDPLGNRAWIKTDATIAGGNSGGLATNSRAEIIGIPTREGTSSANQVTDCRFIEDTNGDGVIDGKDTCVPTGGFINAIRPVNWALPLIKSAQVQAAYVSPYDTPNIEPTPSSGKTSALRFTFKTWTTAVNANQCPTKPVDNYPSGTKKIMGVFQFTNMTSGEKWSYRWLYDTRELATENLTWDFESSGSCFVFYLENAGNPLPDGKYKLEIYAGTDLALSGSAQTQIGDTTGGDNRVIVTGKVVDANTGKGIADIYVIVLKPGIDPNDWLKNTSNSEVFSVATTDSKGQFSIPFTLERGKSYGFVVGNSKSDYRTVVGSIKVKADTPDTLNLNIELNK